MTRTGETGWIPARTRALQGWLALAGLVLGLLSCPAVWAQVPGEEVARHAFEEGVALEKKGDYAAALARFRESAQIKATLGNRFHAAFCLEMTGKLAAALNEYEAVDRTAHEQNKKDVIEATRARLEPLRPRVPQLSLRLVPPPPKDVEVVLDATAVSPALLDGTAFRVDPGEHTIAAKAPDRASFSRQVTVAEGAALSVDIAMEPWTPAPQPEPPARHTQERPQPRSNALPILTAGGAAVLAAGGIAAFVLAGSAQAAAQRTCPARVSCDDERSTVRTLDAFALAGFVGAAALAGLSVLLWTHNYTNSSKTMIER